MTKVVIVGAGHAGAQTAASLREEGFDGSIALLDAQRHWPYQRPPLSKAFMKGEASQESLALRGPDFFAQRRIDLMLGERVAAIRRADRQVHLAGGGALDFDHLVLATGAQARPFPVPGATLAGVAILRTFDDASSLRELLGAAAKVVVIGAGFIGLEFAAVAATLGRETTVLDIAPRVMARAVSPITSRAFEEKHRALGSTLMFGVAVAEIEGAHGRVAKVRLTDGRVLPADLVVVGVGVLAEDGLAREAGLAIDNGIIVDDHLRTSDAAISAIGDNASFPSRYCRTRIRLEAVQNAVDQGRCVARRLAGKAEPYAATPWFWSDQADFKLQIAGVATEVDEFVARGDAAAGSLSVFGVRGGEVVVVESINRAGDHMAARRFLGVAPLLREQAADESYDLKAHAMRASRRAP